MQMQKRFPWSLRIRSAVNGGTIVKVGVKTFAYGPGQNEAMADDVRAFLVDPDGAMRAVDEKHEELNLCENPFRLPIFSPANLRAATARMVRRDLDADKEASQEAKPSMYRDLDAVAKPVEECPGDTLDTPGVAVPEDF